MRADSVSSSSTATMTTTAHSHPLPHPPSFTFDSLWPHGVRLPDEELKSARRSDEGDEDLGIIAPFLTNNEPVPPRPPRKSQGSLGSRSFNLLRAKSSTNLRHKSQPSRNSESNSIAETRTSHDESASIRSAPRPTNNASGTSLNAPSLFQTLKKKASQKFLKTAGSMPDPSFPEPVPPLPPKSSSPYSSYSLSSMSMSMATLRSFPPSPPGNITSFGRRTNRSAKPKSKKTSQKAEPAANDILSEFGSFTEINGRELVLDTDFDNMTGIVNQDVLTSNHSSTAHPTRGSVGCSTTSGGSPTHSVSDWDLVHNQSSSFGTSDNGSASAGRTEIEGGLTSSPLATSPPFRDPFAPSTSRGPVRIFPVPPSLSPKSSIAGPSSYNHSHSQSLDQYRNQTSSSANLSSWNVPESWAVNDVVQPDYDDSSSEHSMQIDGSPPMDDDSTYGRLLLNGTSQSISSGISSTRKKLTSRQGSDATFTSLGSGGLPKWKGKEKSHSSLGLGDDELSGRPKNITGPGAVQYLIRVYRVDGKVHRAKLPLNATVNDLITNLQKRMGLSKDVYRLYLQERGRERLLAGSEKPALLVKRRLEQAGYEVADGMEHLGAEDISFLMKFIFKSVRLRGLEEDAPPFENYVHVDLTGRSLQTIPVVLHAHAQEIVSLNLSKNPLLEIPLDFIQSCESLREIRLSHMAIKNVPASLRHSTCLQRVDISCNRIDDLTEAGFDVLRLHLLKAHNNRMERLPEYFSRMDSLKFLTISNNKFDHLPLVVCDMSNLVDLDISFNTLQSLPDEIWQLNHLERLIIVGNQISKFPAASSGLIALKELDCRRNVIADLSLVCRLPKLVTLRADHNVVHSLAFSFGPCLETIDVSHNDITKLTVPTEDENDGSASLVYPLKSLDISHAKLSSIDDLPFHRLNYLQVLKLDYNSIRSIPESFSSLAELRQFSCTNNILDALPARIGNLQKLERINVQHNNLNNIPSSLWMCGALESLNATSNLLKIWHGYSGPESEHVEHGNTALETRKGSLASNISSKEATPLALSLQRLYLGDNKLDDDVFTALRHLKQLRTLNLCFNEIQDIPRWYFQQATYLQELFLSGNKLSSIPTEDLHRMSSMKALYLNGNKLQTLPAELGKIKTLEILDVGSNLLKYNINNWEFDWNWNFNARLKYLNFSGNKRFEIKPNRAGQRAIPQPPGGITVQEFSQFKETTELRVLGLMDVNTMFTGGLPDDNEGRRVRTSPKEVCGMGYGIADTLGRMDQLVMQDLVVPEFRQRKNESIFGMFGRAVSAASSGLASNFLREEFCSTFNAELQRSQSTQEDHVRHALRRSFLGLNKKLYNQIATGAGSRKLSQASATLGVSSSASIYKVGASGIVVYIVDKQMYIANCGDTLAVLSRHGNCVLMSRHHDPFDRAETARIRMAEGWVSPKGMVNDEFELSRSFGMFNLLPAVNARPDIETRTLVEGDEFVIIANRGIWDYVSYQTAVDIAREDRHDPMLAAQKLRDFALSYGADGSTMCMVISVGDLFDSPDPLVKMSRPPRDEIADKNLGRISREVEPPVGQVTIVFTDIRNSTHLWEVNPGMRTAILLHHKLMRRLLRNIGGYEVKTEGDAFMVSFSSVLPALLWCLSVQIQLLGEDWPLEILESQDGQPLYDEEGFLIARGLSVRMGIHVGSPNCEPDPITRRMDYLGPMVNRSARINDSAEGGQIMVSADVVKAIRERIPDDGSSPPTEMEALDPTLAYVVDEIKRIGFQIIPVGEKKMKGLELPEMVSAVYPADLVGRHTFSRSIVSDDKGTAASQVPFSIEQINRFGMVCLRLEALSSSRIFRHVNERKSSINPEEEVDLEARILYADPSLLLPAIPEKAPAHHLMLVLDMLAVRIENALATLALRSDAPSSNLLSEFS